MRAAKTDVQTSPYGARVLCPFILLPAVVPLHTPHDVVTDDSNIPAMFIKEVKATERFWDIFTANIRNRHTRRPYYNAICPRYL